MAKDDRWTGMQVSFDVSSPASTCRRAIVLFEDRRDLSYLLLLRRGFRHCFCAIGDQRDWIVVDPLKGRMEIFATSGLDEMELAAHFGATGRSVLIGNLSYPSSLRSPRLPKLLTCVEIVKRTLRLDAPNVFTPAQLHETLLRRYDFVPLSGIL